MTEVVFVRKFIDTDGFSERLRRNLVRQEDKKVLLAKFDDSLQARDKYTNANIGGIGRIREFSNYSMHLSRARRVNGRPIPMLRGHRPTDLLRSQVFQLAGCNWRCWYCFVDDGLLSAQEARGVFCSGDDLVDAYLSVEDRPGVIDLSGGQPDLVPEWCLWVMEAVESRGLRDRVLIWQDDNLSSTLLFDVLAADQINYMASFPGHSRVGCFKGFDESSFSFNTLASPELFDRQFSVFRRLLEVGFDLYAYATFTAPAGTSSLAVMNNFVDRLQAIHPRLPLRTIPLEIRPFSVTASRMRPVHDAAIQEQFVAGNHWDEVLRERFSQSDLSLDYTAIDLRAQ